MYCRTRYLCVLIALTCLFAMGSLASAATLEVGSGNKKSYTTIQAAVNAAADGDTVLVYPGTYTGTGNCDIDLSGKAISILGTDPEAASVVEATVIDCQGTVSEPHRGFYAVGFAGDISGLTITNGVAEAGGAIYCDSSALALSHCYILDNATIPGQAKVNSDGGLGGGLYVTLSTVNIVDCLISGNATGAGVDTRDATGGNGGDGGGLYAVDSALSISESSIINNSTGGGGEGLTGGAGGQGAGFYVARATIDGCIIEGNTAGAGGDSTDSTKGTGGQGGNGGGVYCENSMEISNSLVAGNRSGQAGDGAIAGADGQGAGIWFVFGAIDHCTIVDNVAAGQMTFTGSKSESSLGAGVFGSTDTTVANSILWGNTPDQLAGQDGEAVTYCNVEDGADLTGKGNLSVDPLFVEAGSWADASDSKWVVDADDDDTVWTGGDYHLSSASPCIDAGDTGFVADVNETDLDGQSRVSGAATDMGAYEAQGLSAVYRFVSPKTGKYFYTISESEKNSLVDGQSDSWTYEGIAYYTYASASDTALMPVYRFWSELTENHFWTISEAERDWLINRYPNVWTYEGAVFCAYPGGSQPDDAKPVYRFWSGALNAHFYTIDETEKQEFIDTLSDVWVYEGIVWYAFDEDRTDDKPDTGEDGENVSGVYEFSAQEGALDYVFELKAYLDGEEAQLDNSSVAFVAAAARMQMDVDFDTFTTQLTGMSVETEFLSFSATISQIGGSIELPLDLYLYGYFDSPTVRGPYAIDPEDLTFPSTSYGYSTESDEMVTVTGSAALEGTKFDVDLGINATSFETVQAATFDSLDNAGILDADMPGTFMWTRSNQEDLLLEATFRGHLVQIYITAVRVQTVGSWSGKLVEEEKSDK